MPDRVTFLIMRGFDNRSVDHAEVETQIQGHLSDGDAAGAVGVALREYGPGLFGYIVAIVRDEDIAGDVFGSFTEDLLAGIEGFGWRSSFRGWAYTLARNASHRYFRDPYIKRGRGLVTQEVHDLQVQIRSATVNYMRTSVKSKAALLREELDPDDQTMLILRVDRGLAWSEIARVMLGEAEADEAVLKTKANGLRKRFQRVKVTLRQRAQETGLI